MRPTLLKARLLYASLLLLFAAVGPAGCTGGSGGTSTLPTQSQNQLVPQSSIKQATGGNVTFAIGITPRKTTAGFRTPQYISPSTESMQILTDGGEAVVVDLSPSSPNCSPNPSVAGSYICMVSLNVTAGDHVFTVTTYDLPGARGNVLSTNSTGTVDVKATGTTMVSIVLNGVVEYAVLTLATPNPKVGTAVTIGLTIVLQDADHNIIVGPGTYDHPVTLTTTDGVNGPISKTMLSSPADASGITVHYDGANVASITYSATAIGLPTANVTKAVLTPMNPCSPKDASLFGHNLVVNPGADAGPGAPDSPTIDVPPGWTVTGTMTAVEYGASGGFPDKNSPGPSDRGSNFFAGGPSAPLSSAAQRIDVSGASVPIDCGDVSITLSAYLGGFDSQDDFATVTLVFLARAGKSLGTTVVGPVTKADRADVTGLLKRETTGKVPIGTRAVMVTITSTREEGSYNDGYADDINVLLSN